MQQVGKSVVVIDGKEIEVTEFAGNETGAVEKAFEHLISTIAKGQFEELSAERS